MPDLALAESRKLKAGRPVRLALLIAGGLLVAAAAACAGDDDSGDGGGGDDTTGAPTVSGSMEFESSAFGRGEDIPNAYTCDGDDASPPLSWFGVPDDAETIAVEMLDPDAGGFVHWIIYDIPARSGGLTANMPQGEVLDDGSRQAINAFGEAGYGGPCPPPGEQHEYVFRLYALDAELGDDISASARTVQDALTEHTVALSELTGTYGR
jgi:Raf kinase inhibitor-like YbhB/YbcL family protein